MKLLIIHIQSKDEPVDFSTILVGSIKSRHDCGLQKYSIWLDFSVTYVEGIVCG